MLHEIFVVFLEFLCFFFFHWYSYSNHPKIATGNHPKISEWITKTNTSWISLEICQKILFWVFYGNYWKSSFQNWLENASAICSELTRKFSTIPYGNTPPPLLRISWAICTEILHSVFSGIYSSEFYSEIFEISSP